MAIVESFTVRCVIAGIDIAWKLAETREDYQRLNFTLHGACLAMLADESHDRNEEAEDFRFLSDLAACMRRDI